MTDSLRIEEILIGERVRKDMGDLDSLAESMRRHGLLHPVVVKKDRTLVAGYRRIEAARRIGWQEIPVTMIEVEDLLSAERDENSERKDFTPSEAVAIGKLIEEQERPKAEQRQRGGSVQISEGGDVRNIVGKAVGMSGTSYERAKAVVAAAESDPKHFGDLPNVMDESGNVSGTYREMKRRMNGETANKEFNGKRAKRHGFRNDKTAPYDPKTKGQIQRAEGQKKRMESSLSIVTGHCRGLEELDVPMALSVCSKQEIKTWEKRARELSSAFRKLAGKLQKGIHHGR